MVVDHGLAEPTAKAAVERFAEKARWHREQAALPLKEKVRILLGTVYNTERPYSTEVADPRAALISR